MCLIKNCLTDSCNPSRLSRQSPAYMPNVPLERNDAVLHTGILARLLLLGYDLCTGAGTAKAKKSRETC